MQQAVESRFQNCISEFIIGEVFGQGTSHLKVHSDSYLVLKKIALLPLIHMLQLDDKEF